MINLVVMLVVVLTSGVLTESVAGSVGIGGIGITLSTKAHWDGATQSCLPQERGWCLHISFNLMPVQGQIIGTIEKTDPGTVTLRISRSKGMDKEMYDKYFTDKVLIVNEPVTIEPAILEKLGLPKTFTISEGEYPYMIQGDDLVITIKK